MESFQRELEYYRNLASYFEKCLEIQNSQLEAEDGYEPCKGCNNVIYADDSAKCECNGVCCSRCVQSEPRFRSHLIQGQVYWECAACGKSGIMKDYEWPERPVF